MTILKIAVPLILVLILGAFAYFALVDVPVQQQEVSVEIPHAQLLDQ